MCIRFTAFNHSVSTSMVNLFVYCIRFFFVVERFTLSLWGFHFRTLNVFSWHPQGSTSKSLVRHLQRMPSRTDVTKQKLKCTPSIHDHKKKMKKHQVQLWRRTTNKLMVLVSQFYSQNVYTVVKLQIGSPCLLMCLSGRKWYYVQVVLAFCTNVVTPDRVVENLFHIQLLIENSIGHFLWKCKQVFYMKY